MRIFNKLIISLAIAFSLINVFLAFLGQNDIAIYYVLDTIAYLLITLLYVYINPRARGALDTMGAVVFTGFLIIVALKVVELLR